jgi:hypothetical protein
MKSSQLRKVKKGNKKRAEEEPTSLHSNTLPRNLVPRSCSQEDLMRRGVDEDDEEGVVCEVSSGDEEGSHSRPLAHSQPGHNQVPKEKPFAIARSASGPLGSKGPRTLGHGALSSQRSASARSDGSALDEAEGGLSDEDDLDAAESDEDNVGEHNTDTNETDEVPPPQSI